MTVRKLNEAAKDAFIPIALPTHQLRERTQSADTTGRHARRRRDFLACRSMAETTKSDHGVMPRPAHGFGRDL